MRKYLERARKWVARRIISEGDIKASKSYAHVISEKDRYKEALEGYQKVMHDVADIASRHMNLRAYTDSVDINTPEDAQRLLEEVGKLEKLLTDKNSLIKLHRHAANDAKEEVKELQRQRVPKEFLSSAVEYIPKAILILDNQLGLVSHSSESRKYFGNLQRQKEYSDLFSSSNGFSEFFQRLNGLEKDALLEMRVRVKQKGKMGERKTIEVNTITKPIYSEDNLTGYVVLVEVDSIIRSALEAIKNILPEKTERELSLDEGALETS